MVTATIRVTSGSSPSTIPVSLRIFGERAHNQAFGSGSGEVSVTFPFRDFVFYPSDLFIEVPPLSSRPEERYEIVYSIRPIDKTGPQIYFYRTQRDKNYLIRPSRRTAKFQVLDINGIRTVEVRTEGEPYREIKVGTKRKPIRTAVRSHFRFRQLQTLETVYIKAVDQLGNITVKSHRYRRR